MLRLLDFSSNSSHIPMAESLQDHLPSAGYGFSPAGSALSGTQGDNRGFLQVLDEVSRLRMLTVDLQQANLEKGQRIAALELEKDGLAFQATTYNAREDQWASAARPYGHPICHSPALQPADASLVVYYEQTKYTNQVTKKSQSARQLALPSARNNPELLRLLKFKETDYLEFSDGTPLERQEVTATFRSIMQFFASVGCPPTTFSKADIMQCNFFRFSMATAFPYLLNAKTYWKIDKIWSAYFSSYNASKKHSNIIKIKDTDANTNTNLSGVKRPASRLANASSTKRARRDISPCKDVPPTLPTSSVSSPLLSTPAVLSESVPATETLPSSLPVASISGTSLIPLSPSFSPSLEKNSTPEPGPKPLPPVQLFKGIRASIPSRLPARLLRNATATTTTTTTTPVAKDTAPTTDVDDAPMADDTDMDGTKGLPSDVATPLPPATKARQSKAWTPPNSNNLQIIRMRVARIWRALADTNEFATKQDFLTCRVANRQVANQRERKLQNRSACGGTSIRPSSDSAGRLDKIG
ncbi:hypothetical protein CYLTODRAFT_460123 [Cylindrobasidium torrendii FP15055 ss-10]|uniref:Uncharacterized protein n=1 Tax=Cylindrobasidium torrendii FP15055 ss-10 TaxID=1314674 RepID=A0A0D7ASA7_9AGAR|nr:hypothetical protein CYLTODRAFT_460123 [Cylindrobasidium torrendii FP15055 ss-10]